MFNFNLGSSNVNDEKNEKQSEKKQQKFLKNIPNGTKGLPYIIIIHEYYNIWDISLKLLEFWFFKLKNIKSYFEYLVSENMHSLNMYNMWKSNDLKGISM